MGELGTVVALPRALVQELAAEAFHIAGVGVADIQDEDIPGGEVLMDGGKRLLLDFARGEMRKGAEGYKSQAEFL